MTNPPTAYQRRVWEYVQQIPAGEVRTYGEIAEALDIGRQQIGWILKQCANTVPWWRVVHDQGFLRIPGKLRLAQLILLEDEGIAVDIRVRRKYLRRSGTSS